MIFRESAQRRQILDNLANRFDHPAAVEIYQALKKKLPRLSLGTVYRNLDILEKQGRVQRLLLDPEEMHYDNKLEPHAHFLCHHCKHIWDVQMPEITDSLAQECQTQGFQIERYYLNLLGQCRGCKEKQTTGEDKG